MILKFIIAGVLMAASSTTMALDIITTEHMEHKSMLQTPAKTVGFPLNKADTDLIEAMKVKLYELGGVGLAAPQINQSKRIITVYIPESAALLRDHVTPYPMHVLINPTYEAITNKDIGLDFEGCYSVTSTMGKVPRFNRIKITYADELGNIHHKTESGFYARVLQHEIDHLNGLLITDRLTPECLQGPIKEMMAIRRAELSEDKKVLFDTLMQQKLKK